MVWAPFRGAPRHFGISRGRCPGPPRRPCRARDHAARSGGHTPRLVSMLAVAAHVAGWPFARRGSQSLADALASHLRELGGTIELNRTGRLGRPAVRSEADPARLPPREVLRLAATASLRAIVARWEIPHGPGVFKLDWALSGPVPWRAPGCERAGTLHLEGRSGRSWPPRRRLVGGSTHQRPS